MDIFGGPFCLLLVLFPLNNGKALSYQADGNISGKRYWDSLPLPRSFGSYTEQNLWGCFVPLGSTYPSFSLTCSPCDNLGVFVYKKTSELHPGQHTITTVLSPGLKEPRTLLRTWKVTGTQGGSWLDSLVICQQQGSWRVYLRWAILHHLCCCFHCLPDPSPGEGPYHALL